MKQSSRIETNSSPKYDLRDRLIIYNDANEFMELLVLVVLDLYKNSLTESTEIFYPKDYTLGINFFDVIGEALLVSSKIPYPTSRYLLLDYIDKKYTKINDFGHYSYHLDSCNIIFLEELEQKEILKLNKLKGKSIGSK